MLFTSLEFLFLFFPVTLIGYFLMPSIKLKNYWLMVVSLFFYAWGEPFFVLIMLMSIILNYIFARGIDHYNDNKKLKKVILTVSVLTNLSLIFVYKYLNFVISVIHDAFPSTQAFIPQTDFRLPIGISFFTFQALSYVVDVYRGIPVQKNIGYLCLYISFFPQLIAGPIVRYTTIAEQINVRKETTDMFYNGIIRFLYGFNKKIILANLMAVVADAAFNAHVISVAMAWLGIVCYTLQIFFDFSGYSEMAIGLGLMFGFEFLENFDYPYISKTITEFWRRWHMSLGSWFRDYVYFPLGGSRVVTKTRLVFNLFVVWLATGIWHGASWNFILWGVLYGMVITIEKLMNIPKYIEQHKVVGAFYRVFTLLAVMFGWVLFRAVDLASAVNYFKCMFGLAGNSLIDTAAVFNFEEYVVIIMVSVICSTPFFKNLKKGREGEKIITFVVQFVLFLISVSYLVMNAHNPFIYFNF